MTTRSGDASDPESRWWWRLGHASPWLSALLMGVAGAGFLIDAPPTNAAGAAAAAGVVVVSTLGMRHDHQVVCIRCLREQPDGGGELATRKMSHLWSWHHRWAFALWVMLACGVAWLVAAPPASMGAVVVVWHACGSFTTYTHRKLKPWCPWCREPSEAVRWT
jgi:hypothetical protein